MEDHCNSNQCFTEPRVVYVTTDQHTTLSSVWGPNSILEPAFPAVEPLLASKQGDFGNRIGVPVRNGSQGWHARSQTALELLHMYSIPDDPWQPITFVWYG